MMFPRYLLFPQSSLNVLSEGSPCMFPKWTKDFVIVHKGCINLVLADPQEFFKQHLIKKEEQTSYSKNVLALFGGLALCPWSSKELNIRALK